MTLTLFHGTTAENVPGILATGPRPGSWASPDPAVARHFALSRSRWNGMYPVVFVVRCKVKGVRLDRSGRPEARIARVLSCTQLAD